MKNKKNKVIFIAIGILVAILSVIGVSYALWTFTGVQKDKNIIKLDCFDITFAETENSHVSLQNAFPLKDSEGKTLKPYHFKVTNKCANFANFVVQLEVKKSSTLDDEYLKVMLNEKDPKLLKNENYPENDELISKETKKGYILDSGYLDVNESKEYDLRIWLDENVTLTSKNANESLVQNSTWGGIVTLSATYLGENHTTLAGKNVPIVTSGDGLYEVSHEDSSLEGNWKNTEYRYAGSNPDNYVDFNGELWRIIGLVNVKTTGGTIEQRVKIIRNDSIGNYSWDSSSIEINNGYGVNEWSQADLKTLLNDYYYNRKVGQNCYTNHNNATTTCDFGENSNIKGLDDEAKSMIDETIEWNTGTNGERDYASDGLASHFYEYERSSKTGKVCITGDNCTDGVDRTTEWNKFNNKNGNGDLAPDLFHSIGLMYPSDYGYATIGGSKSRDDCLKKELYNWNNNDYATECGGNDWLKPSSGYYWTLSPRAESSDASIVFRVTSSGYVSSANAIGSIEVLPVIYLSPSVVIIGGTGKKDDAYQLRSTSLEGVIQNEVKKVDTGDGLYLVDHKTDGTDIGEEWKTAELRYAGKDPNNYVKFNDELWRIIGLVNVKTESGTVEQRVKMIKQESIGAFSWDSSKENVNNGTGVNEWSKSDLKILLNDFYYNKKTDQNCYNDNNEISSTCNFGESTKVKGLDDEAKSMIDEKISWNIGTNGTNDYTSALISDFYKYERSSNIGKICTYTTTYCSDDITRTTEWSEANAPSEYHGIGLIYPSDYGYAAGGSIENRAMCLTQKMSGYANCKDYDWLYLSSENYWTLSPYSHSSDAGRVFYVSSDGYIGNAYAHMPYNVLPTLYLKSNVIVTNLDKADGSSTSPYELALLE